MASILRITAQRAAAIPSLARSISTSVVRKDLVQDLYVSQLKSYKAPTQAKDAHAGLVRNFSAPSSPQAPALPTDLAGELAKFDTIEPVLGSSPTLKSAVSSTEGGESADEYLSFLEQDLPKADKHH